MRGAKNESIGNESWAHSIQINEKTVEFKPTTADVVTPEKTLQ